MTSYPSAPPPGQPGAPGPYGTPPPATGQSWPGQLGAGGGVHDAPPPGGGGGAPVCPRHPDRVSYVRCQRCGRPVCPECQRQAAVGVHCVDCVREGNRSVAARRTVFGAMVRPGSRPVVTLTMMVLCIGLFVLDLAGLPIYAELGYSPAAGRTEPWRMLTAAFLHASILHIGFNMVALWFTGPFLEEALGRARFLALYLISAFGGSVAVLLLTPVERWGQGVVGASGAVFGLFGAVAVVMLRLKSRNTSIFGVIGLNLVITFLVPNISWQGHLGGIVTGAAIALVYAYAPAKSRVPVTIAGVGGIAVLLLVVTVLRYALA